MKLSEWARQKGVTYKTAWRLWKSGKFPEPTEQLATGTIIVLRESIPEVPVRIYARVSSNDQRPDLERQVSRLASYAAEHGLYVEAVIKEVGSGLNGHRKELLSLLKSPAHILVEHRDRLCRFGFEYLESALSAQSRRIIVADPQEVEERELYKSEADDLQRRIERDDKHLPDYEESLRISKRIIDAKNRVDEEE